MMLLFLLLLLLTCSSNASHFYGTVMTYYPTNTPANGSVTVVLRYKASFHSCSDYTQANWQCQSGNCGTQTSLVANTVDRETSGEFCQTEGVSTRQVPTNAPFQLWLNSGNWISNAVNGISRWRALTRVELRNRSDTGQANRSPQTTVLPAVRVPSNCPRDFNLLTFDPDGDEVRCRYGIASLSECNPCTPPSVLNLSASCTLSFSSTSRSNEGPYAVQLVMEDFPRQNITLTQTNGLQEAKTTNDGISKIPVQFVLRVDPVVPSCTEGLYLPKFVSPTPDNGARLHIPVGETLEINIKAEALNSTISELLFSGPHNMNETSPGTGPHVLRWTPSQSEDGQSHPVCFVVQADFNSTKYHSELRCVIVTVGNVSTTISSTTTPITTVSTTSPPAGNQNVDSIVVLRTRITSLSSLTEEDIRTTVLQQLKEELVRKGLPSNITLSLVSSRKIEVTTTATPGG